MRDLSERYLTTRELAALLRIRERKVYELVAKGEVPCSKATGKLLFPRQEVESWLLRHGSGLMTRTDALRPDVVLGSHDPLLDWAIRASGSGFATFYDGSSDGLDRFVSGEGAVAGLHLFHAGTESWNTEFVKEKCSNLEAVLIEFGWRDRGLLVPRGNPHGVESIADLLRLRLAARQPGAGAEMLMNDHLEENAIDSTKVNRIVVARTETEAATAVTGGEADVCFGLRSVAKQHQLAFVPVGKERFDLLIDRRMWFESGCQALLGFMKSGAFLEKCERFTGYDCGGLGTIHYNG